jgi:ABC-type transporter Mla subunit MlaD
MKKNLTDFFVAIMVIACSLVLLAALAYALSGRRSSKGDRILEIDYPDVTGIKLHSDVRYAGAAAGSVTNIRLLTFAERESAQTAEQKRNAVRITVTLLKEVPPLPGDVRASLSSETLLSEKFVALSAGSPAAPKLASGAILQGHSGGGLDGLFEAIGPMTENLPPLLKTAEDLLKSMDPLLKKTEEAVDTVKVTVSDIGPRATKLLDGLKTTSESADAAIKNVNKLVDGPKSPVATDLEELRNTLAKLQQTLASANQLLGKTDKNLDARMQELGVVMQNLKVVTTHAKALTQTIGEHPHRLLFGGKPNKLTPEQEILRSSKPLPGTRP